MEILYILLVLLAVTRTFGELAVRLNQPALVGELISGIGLGLLVRHNPDWFPVLAHLDQNPVFTAITDLGIFFLMLMAGLELRPTDIVKTSGMSLVIALCGLVLPLAGGFALAWAYLPDSQVRVAQATFVGTALAITAVPVAVRVLMDLGQLNTRAGKVVVSAAVFDDVLSLGLMAVLVAMLNTGRLPGWEGMAMLAGRIVLFFGITVAVGHYLLPWVGRWVRKLLSDEFEFTALLLVALAFGVLAEQMHLHFILGAFVAGLFFGQNTVGPEHFEGVQKRVSGITVGFLAPIFFASIGFHLHLGALWSVPVFAVLLVLLAFFSKLIGAGVPAFLMGLPARTAASIGVAMSARGAVELVIADLALRSGLLDQPEPVPPIVASLFSCVVIVAILTTLATPIILRVLMGPKRTSASTDDQTLSE
ncbi:MAG: cation:proton antiporter [Phycisphaeraceae bacterium]|nr:cation:proton antiporter [Phycisphaeraceae bacterium]